MGPDDKAPPDNPDPDSVIEPDRWRRLDDYFADRLPLADRVEMERWVAERPERVAMVAQLREVWHRAERAAPELGPVDIRQVLNTLAAKRGAIDAAALRQPASVVGFSDYRRDSTRRRVAMSGRRLSSALTIAAAAGLILVVAIPLRYQSRPATPSAAVEPMREFVTKRAQQATLDLADGSQVILAAGSRLRVPVDFNVRGANGTRRELYLSGKAFFQVEHDASRPFLVHSGTVVTEDVGTDFVVSAYPETQATQVAVVSGSVAVRQSTAPVSSPAEAQKTAAAKASSTLLRAGDVARVQSTGETRVEHNVALAPYVSWTRGILAFDNAPVRDALAELSRWYDVDFELRGNSRDTLRVTGEFRDEPISAAIHRLELMLDVRATRENGVVRLSAGAK